MPDDLIDHANDPLDMTGYDAEEVEGEPDYEPEGPSCRLCQDRGCWNCR